MRDVVVELAGQRRLLEGFERVHRSDGGLLWRVQVLGLAFDANVDGRRKSGRRQDEQESDEHE